VKILINAVSAKSGGAATYLGNLARSLSESERGHHYLLLVPPQSSRPIVTYSESVTVLETTIGSAPAWRRFLWDQLSVRQLVKKEGIDIIVSSSDFGMVWPPCPQLLLLRNALFFSQLYRRRILARHSWRERLMYLLRKLLITVSAKSATRVLVASQSMMREVQEDLSLSEGKLHVNPFGIPWKQFQSSDRRAMKQLNGARGDVFRMLYVAEYGDYKNFTVLYRAIKVLSQQGINDILLVTTADPWQNSATASISRHDDQRLAADPFVAPFVTNVGYLSYEEVPGLYAESDLVLFPSLLESFGHPLVEAMASGRPILAADTAINREICGEAAHYADPFDAEGFAKQIQALRGNAALRDRLGAEGLRRVEQYFMWHDYVERLVRMLEEVNEHAKQHD